MAEKKTGFRKISEESVREKTGRGWAEWLRILDDWDAMGKWHTLSAKHLLERYGLGHWRAQAVAIRYEWERGLRR